MPTVLCLNCFIVWFRFRKGKHEGRYYSIHLTDIFTMNAWNATYKLLRHFSRGRLFRWPFVAVVISSQNDSPHTHQKFFTLVFCPLHNSHADKMLKHLGKAVEQDKRNANQRNNQGRDGLHLHRSCRVGAWEWSVRAARHFQKVTQRVPSVLDAVLE